MQKKQFFATLWVMILVGIIIGVIAPLLQKFGNPSNMGICVACFERDIAGALGLHRASPVQYIRPEIIGLVLGSMIAALIFKEFKPRTGSSPIIRFVLGAFAMIGALIFLGCPWRTLLRLAGGDFNALTGLAGLGTGIFIGVLFLKSGYNLGRSRKTYTALGWVMPGLMLGLFLLAVFLPQFSIGGPIFSSSNGPGSLHAHLLISLGAGLVIGFLAQRTRFCTMGALRDVMLIRDMHLMSGVIALAVTAFITNLVLGQVKFGFILQPVSHSNHIWNFLGMVLAGLCFSLAGGCPGRQLFLSGEGDGDAAIFVLGMIVGAGFAHNFNLAGTPDKMIDGVIKTGGISIFGMIALATGLVFCIVIGFTMRDKKIEEVKL